MQKGRHHSEETKRKMREIALKRDPFSEETRRKMSLAKIGKEPWNKGLTKETDDRVMKGSEFLKRLYKDPKNHPWYGRHHSEEAKRKIGRFNKGKKVSEETRQKLSEAGRGKLHSEETKRKISHAESGENHYNWQGGKSLELYPIEFNGSLKRIIRERDNYVCQICEEWGNRVHHIDYCKENNSLENLITLCCPCHGKTNFNREYWESFFGSKALSFDLPSRLSGRVNLI